MQDTPSREELQKIARARLYPSLTNPSYLVLRRRRQILAGWIDKIPGNRLMVLDVGGRLQPYRPLLGERIAHYIALDALRTPLVDIVGSGQQLPFKSESFDLVISTAVFDYLPEPHLAATEVHRVLKTGGHLMMSVASVFPRIADDEYWRFLPAGLRHILSPFAKVEIVPEVRSIGGFFRFIAVSLNIIAKYEWLRMVFRCTAIPLLNVAGVALDRDSISRNEQIAGNYCAWAQK
jgi:SAM-dependent methyltransferase